jgi:hypothetical protein
VSRRRAEAAPAPGAGPARAGPAGDGSAGAGPAPAGAVVVPLEAAAAGRIGAVRRTAAADLRHAAAAESCGVGVAEGPAASPAVGHPARAPAGTQAIAHTTDHRHNFPRKYPLRECATHGVKGPPPVPADTPAPGDNRPGRVVPRLAVASRPARRGRGLSHRAAGSTGTVDAQAVRSGPLASGTTPSRDSRPVPR